MDFFDEAVKKIIVEQEMVMGPIAWEQANKVPGIKIDANSHVVKLQGDKKDIVEHLVEKYRDLFGQASVEVCREAVAGLLSQVAPDDIPPLLK